MDLSHIAIPLLTTVETVRICTPTIVEGMLGRVRREVCDRRLEEWAEVACGLAHIDLHVHGREKIDRDKTYILMSNHQSSYDIFTIMRAFPGTLRMVSKIEMFRIPILGPAMYNAEFVPLDRSDKGKAREGLEYAKQKLESGVNVWIAPEGTRSNDGRLLPFKKGGFVIALQTGHPILPVTVSGSREVLRSKGYRVYRDKRVDVTFHDAIDPVPYGTERRDELVERVRDTIASALPESMR
ncbi:MAG: 1-acyl-sn-glycerol-3-phosphate acyltransferase [Myxococcales bacterium]|nr:1-acyl-sn-glycerol-3-phosphate acyltransferase [Myxococcales bacterium]